MPLNITIATVHCCVLLMSPFDNFSCLLALLVDYFSCNNAHVVANTLLFLYNQQGFQNLSTNT